MVQVHGYASLPHYQDHIAPILAALPANIAGPMWGPRQGLAWGMELPPELAKAGDDVWFIVAGLPDAQRFNGGRNLIYVEHGAGQTYRGLETHGSYSGGDHRGLNIRLYLAPSATVAGRWPPGSSVAIVGCPRLDRLHARRHRPNPGVSARNHVTGRTVAFTWHWWNEQIPETLSAFPHYEQVMYETITRLRTDGITPIGHAHPRYAGKMAGWYMNAGIPWIPTLNDVLSTADALVGDNTSALPEAASCGIPVCWLNAPWYRRDVHHGGRFWDWPTGQVTCDNPEDLYDRIIATLDDPPAVRASRERMVTSVYAHTDGQAASRAVSAIMETIR